MGKGDGAEKSKLLDNGVCSESQSSACSVGRKRQEIHPGVVTLDGSVVGDEVREDKVMVEVSEGELMLFDEWLCEWGEETKGRRQRGRVFHSLPEQTWCISTPAQLSRGLLWPSTLSIRSGTCVPSEHHGIIRSF